MLVQKIKLLEKIRIEASSGLSDEEIKKMKEEAEKNAESDKQAKEEADKINGADALIFSTEKQLKEYGDKISADKKAPIENELKALKDAYSAKNFADIDAASERLNAAWAAASEEMYKAGAADGGQAQDASQQEQSGGSDDVTDVDFEEVKEDDKK